MANTLKFGNGNWATKEDSVLAYNDENNNFKPLPFDFTRASTATYVDSDGLIKTSRNGEARIDYTDSSDGALLLEPSRTNSISYSDDFSQSVWTKTNVTVTADATIAPDGTLNASKLTENTGNGTHRISDTIIVSGTGVAYTQSVFAKSGGSGRYLRMFRGSGTYNDAVFDLENGTVVTTDGNNLISVSIEEHSNGWYRCISTYTTQFSNIATYYGLQNGITDSYTGDGTSHIYLWGAMLEEGSYATSYIPTSGSSVTRIAETCNNSGNSEVFNDSEGVLFADISALDDDLTNRAITISDGGITNKITMFYTNVSNAIQVKVVVGGSNSLNNYITIPNTSLYNKFALKYKQNDFSLFVNGFELITDTSGNTFSNGTLTELAFDRGDAAEDFYGKTKELGYYDTALTDLELETLTSYTSWVSMVNALKLNIIYNG